MEGGHAWDARVNLYGDQSDELSFFDVNKFDMTIKLELGTPKIIFLNKTIVDVMVYINGYFVVVYKVG